MALRVLLADENVTIKKVIQLSLQDYAVSIKSVNMGLNIPEIAREFKPDIFFIDVLLQKKDGYSVCHELKNDPELSQIPKVLMWSGFIELDEQKFQECGAKYRLEKPFDKDALRKIVQTAVSKTQSQDLSGFIQTPEAPKINITPPIANLDGITNSDITPSLHDSSESPTQTSSFPGINQVSKETTTEEWNMNSFAAIELPPELAPTTTPPLNTPVSPETVTENKEEFSEDWLQGNIAQFKLDPNLAETDGLDLLADTNVDMDQQLIERPSSTPQETYEPDSFITTNTPLDYAASTNPSNTDSTAILEAPQDLPENQIKDQLGTSLSNEKVEEIVREMINKQCKESLDAAIWKILPDMAEKILREEIAKLVRESEKLT